MGHRVCRLPEFSEISVDKWFIRGSVIGGDKAGPPSRSPGLPPLPPDNTPLMRGQGAPRHLRPSPPLHCPYMEFLTGSTFFLPLLLPNSLFCYLVQRVFPHPICCNLLPIAFPPIQKPICRHFTTKHIHGHISSTGKRQLRLKALTNTQSPRLPGEIWAQAAGDNVWVLAGP